MVDMWPAVWAGQSIRQLLPVKDSVDLVGAFDPTLFAFNAFPKDVKPSDLAAQVTRDKTEIPRVRQNHFWSQP